MVKEAAMGPVRDINPSRMRDINKSDIQPVKLIHFEQAIQKCRPSVSKQTLLEFKQWES